MKQLDLLILNDCARRNKALVFLLMLVVGACFYFFAVFPNQIMQHVNAEPTKKGVGTVVGVGETFTRWGGHSRSIVVHVNGNNVGGLSTLPVKIGDTVEVEYTEFGGVPQRMARVYSLDRRDDTSAH
jgi:hypothetical protein